MSTKAAATTTVEMVQRERILIDIELTGLTAILIHKGTTVTKTKSRRADAKYDQEWQQTCYVDSDGYVCIPDLNLEAMILAAGRSRKVGKHYLKKYIAYAVVVEQTMVRMLVNGKPVTLQDVADNDWIFVTGAVVDGKRIDRYRVQIPAGWQLRFQIGLDDCLLKPEMLHEILIDGGRQEGLCDWRPGAPKKPGKFGQFYVSRFDVKKS